MKNSFPKIVFKEDCVDLRDLSPQDKKRSVCRKGNDNPKLNYKQKPKQSKNEGVTRVLEKLAKSYQCSDNSAPPELNEVLLRKSLRKSIKTFSDRNGQKNSNLKSQSELSTHKYTSVSVSPSSPSPTIQSSKKENGHQRIDPFKNKFTMTKSHQSETKQGKTLVKNQSIEKLLDKLVDEKPSHVNNALRDHPIWKDPRLSEKYSVLKVPWKKSHTLPVFCHQPSFLAKESYSRKSVEFSDKKTYFYDDGSEVDSSYIVRKRHQCFSTVFQNQLLTLLNLSAYLCAIVIMILIVWFLSGNKFLYKMLVPQPPQATVLRNIKFLGGGLIYAITSIFKFIGRIFTIPTHQVYHQTPEYSWPPTHNDY